jgi:hypothetical protein
MICKFCGKPATIDFEDLPICEDCYHNAGSCCREFGADDLWERREDDSRQPDMHDVRESHAGDAACDTSDSHSADRCER